MPRIKGAKNRETLVKEGKLPKECLTMNHAEFKAYQAGIVTVEKPDSRSEEQVVNEIKERFDIYGKMVRGVINGQFSSFIVTGSAGVGKSYTAHSMLKAQHDKDTRFNYHFIAGGAVSGIELYELVYKYRNRGDVLVLDDSDRVFGDEDSMNVLKAALDTSFERTVSWYTDHPKFKGENPLPQTFSYLGSMIFITNKNLLELSERANSMLTPHIQAFLSRSILLDTKMHSRREVALWVYYLTTAKKMLQGHLGITAPQEKEAVKWIVDNREKLIEISLRTAIKVGKFMQMDGAEWERIARVTLLKRA